MDLEDVRNLLPPLLSLLDGRHDVPFPKDKGKGSAEYPFVSIHGISSGYSRIYFLKAD